MAFTIRRLPQRPQIVVVNKIDLPDVRRRLKQFARPFERRNIEVLAISAATGEGIGPLLEEVWRRLKTIRDAHPGGDT